MSDEQLAYIVTYGSDERVEAIFTDEAKRDAFLESHPHSTYATWRLNEPENGHAVRHGFALTAFRPGRWQQNLFDAQVVDGWLIREFGNSETSWDVSTPTSYKSFEGFEILGKDRDDAYRMAYELIAQESRGTTP
jgi:hypothetical protein